VEKRHVGWNYAAKRAAANLAFTSTGIIKENPIDWVSGIMSIGDYFLDRDMRGDSRTKILARLLIFATSIEKITRHGP
jgi:hypothetical protein